MPRFYRLTQIIGDKKKGIVPMIPVSRAAWYAGIKSGRYPAGVRLGERTVAWPADVIDALCARLASGNK